MRYFKIALSFLAGLFVFSSCQKSDLVGLEQTTFIKGRDTSLSVKAITERDSADSYTNGLSQHPFGFLSDPIFGTTEANLAFALSLPSEGFKFGTNPVLDSAVLVLKYGNEFYGDSTKNSVFNINVHQLQEEYIPRSYIHSKTWAAGLKLGDATVTHFPWRDSILIKEIRKGKADTTIKVAPQLRIKLNAAQIQNLFINASESNFASNSAFMKYIKGLYLTLADKSYPAGKGGITFFDLATSGGSKLDIYYTTTSTENVKDTLTASFSINSTNAASNIKHVYPQAIKTQLAASSNPEASSETLYLQALAGLRGKILMPELSKLKAKGPSLAINKAELVVTVVDGTYDNVFKPAPRLTLYRTDIAGLRKPVPDNAIGIDPRFTAESMFGGFYNSARKEYRFVVTSYIQDLIKGNLKDYGTFIAPINKALTGTYNVNPAANTAARVVVGGDERSSYKIKLDIIYTNPE